MSELIPRLRLCRQCGSMLAIGNRCGTCLVLPEHEKAKRAREMAEREERGELEGEP